MVTYFEILCGVVALLLALYYYSTSNFDFWKKRGVDGPPPSPFFGHSKDLLLVKIPLAIYLQQLTEKFRNAPMIGLFMGKTPVLVLTDPEFIKDVLVRDFSKFADRGFNVFEKVRKPIFRITRSGRWNTLTILTLTISHKKINF